MKHPLRIHWLDSARFEVRKIQRPLAMRVFTAVQQFAQSGRGDMKPLHGELADAFRLRVGEYRVLFTIEDGAMASSACATVPKHTDSIATCAPARSGLP